MRNANKAHIAPLLPSYALLRSEAVEKLLLEERTLLRFKILPIRYPLSFCISNY